MIDAHVHLWQLGRNACVWPDASLPALHRDVELPELLGMMDAAGADAAILVQSQESEADTRWLLALARGASRIAGVIGWVDLAASDAAARIDALAGEGPLIGLRPMLQDRDPAMLDDPAIDAALTHLAARGLVFDALVRPAHLFALARLAARHPGLRIVIDHGAKPAIGGDMSMWRDGIVAVAAYANVACKLSGLLTECVAGAAPGALPTVIAHLHAHFGAERLVWGSDWPVVTLAADVQGWLAQARAAVPAADHDAVFAGNAARIYRLGDTGA